VPRSRAHHRLLRGLQVIVSGRKRFCRHAHATPIVFKVGNIIFILKTRDAIRRVVIFSQHVPTLKWVLFRCFL
jgi:hypothetical protein